MEYILKYGIPKNLERKELKMRFFRALKFWLFVKASRLAGIDDFSCSDNWEYGKSDWYNCFHSRNQKDGE